MKANNYITNIIDSSTNADLTTQHVVANLAGTTGATERIEIDGQFFDIQNLNNTEKTVYVKKNADGRIEFSGDSNIQIDVVDKEQDYNILINLIETTYNGGNKKDDVLLSSYATRCNINTGAGGDIIVSEAITTTVDCGTSGKKDDNEHDSVTLNKGYSKISVMPAIKL